MSRRKCWITDFDGTVTLVDFYQAVGIRLLGDEARRFWDAWHTGEIPHLQAMQEIMKRIRIPEDELIAMIEEFEIRDGFMEAYHYARRHNWEIHMTSAGCSYYVEKTLDRLGISLDGLETNEGIYSEEEGLVVTPPTESLWYSDFYGIDKAKYVAALKAQEALVLYSGDGLPDYEALKLADYGFAIGPALEKCRQNMLPVAALETFEPVLNQMRELDEKDGE